MTTIIDLLVFEEGFRARPYLDSEGYPTVGIGFRIGPKWLAREWLFKDIYDFTLPLPAAEAWLRCYLDDLVKEMASHPVIAPAYAATADYYARRCVLISMAYQMGLEGLAKFTTTLGRVAAGRFDAAARNMLQSKWAKQTPNRAKRHAAQMATGKWCEEYTK